MIQIFAYGTLRDAEYQAALFGRTLPTRAATLPGWLAVIAETGYFTIVRAPGESVSGDLVELDGEQLELADAWEDVDYERLRVTVRDATGEVSAFVYVRPTASRERVPPGSLAAHPREHVLERIRILRQAQDDN